MSKIVNNLTCILAVLTMGLSACGGNGSSQIPPNSETKSEPTSSSSNTSENSSTNSSELDSSSESSSSIEGSSSEGSSEYSESSESSDESTSVSICAHENVQEYYSYDDDYHWHECSDCGEKLDLEEHDYEFSYRGTTNYYNQDYLDHYRCKVCYHEKSETVHEHKYDVNNFINLGEEGHKLGYLCNCEGYGEPVPHEKTQQHYDGKGNLTYTCFCGYTDTVEADVISSDGIQYRVVKNKAYITGVTDQTKNALLIPSKIDGYDVYAIDDGAYFGSQIHSIMFEEGIKYIGNNALYNLDIHGSVFFPDSLEELHSSIKSDRDVIDEVYFGKNLRELSFHDSEDTVAAKKITFASEYLLSKGPGRIYCNEFEAKEGVTVLPDNLIYDKTYSDDYRHSLELKTISLPSSLIQLGNNFTFLDYEASFLKEDSIYYLGKEGNPYFAAMGWWALDDAVINENTECINSTFIRGFTVNSTLKSLVLPDNLKTIFDSYAYGGWTPSNTSKLNYDETGCCYYIPSGTNPYFMVVYPGSGVEKYVLHEDTKIVGKRAFSNFFKEVVINDGIRYIGEGAFAYDEFPDGFVCPESLIYMGTNILEYATVPSVTLNSNLKILRANAFGNVLLKEINFNDGLEEIEGGAFKLKGTLTLPDGIKRVTLSGITTSKLDFPESVEELSLYNCAIKEIEIPLSVNDFYMAGNNIDKLIYKGSLDEYLSIPTSGGSRGYGNNIKQLYVNDESITSLEINENTTIALGALNGLNSITSIHITEDVTEWDGKVLSGLNNLESLRYDGSLRDFLLNQKSAPSQKGWRLYLGENELTVLELDETTPGLNSFSDSTRGFDNCLSITKVFLKEGFEDQYFYRSPFTKLPNLTEFAVEDGVIYIPAHIMEGCTTLTSIIIHNSVRSIGSSAFKDCKNLTGDLYFGYGGLGVEVSSSAFANTGIESLHMSDGSIGSGAFKNCEDLEYVFLDSEVKSVGSEAFANDSPYLTLLSKRPKGGYENYADDWYVGCFVPITNYTTTLEASEGKYIYDDEHHSRTLKNDNRYVAKYYITVNEKGYTQAYLYSFECVDPTVDCFEINSIINEAESSKHNYFVRMGVVGVCPRAFENAQGLKEIRIDEGNDYGNYRVHIAYGALSGATDLEVLYLNDDFGREYGTTWCDASGNEYTGSIGYLFGNEKVEGSYIVVSGDSDYDFNYLPKSLIRLEVGFSNFEEYAVANAKGIKTIVFMNDEEISFASNTFSGNRFRSIGYKTGVTNFEGLEPHSSSLYGIAYYADEVINIDNEEFKTVYVRSGDYIYRLNDDHSASVVTYLGETTRMSLAGESVDTHRIPAFLESVTYKEQVYNVTSIDPYALSFIDGLKYFKIPGFITAVGDYAFYNDDELYQVAFEDVSSIESITGNAFYQTGLLEIIAVSDPQMELYLSYPVIEKDEDSKIRYHENGYITYNGRIVKAAPGTTFDIPEDVTIIDAQEFTKYEEFNLPSTFKLSNISLSDCLSYIYRHGYETVDEYGVKYYGSKERPYQILGNASDLLDDSYTVHDGCMFIGIEAFKGLSTLKEITIPDSVMEICNSAFYNCKNLKTVNYGKGVHHVGISCFVGTAIENFALPENVVTIGNSAYYGLDIVVLDCPNTLKTIGNSAFANCENIEKINFNEGLERVDGLAFKNCTKITELIFPSTLTSVAGGKNYGAFEGCTSVTKIVSPITSLTYIFGASDNGIIGQISEVTLLEGATSISYEAFRDWTALKSIVIPSSVTEIGKYAFRDCSALETVSFKEDSQLLTIKIGAFKNCVSLKSIAIPSSVTSIETDVEAAILYGCTSLEEITLPFFGPSRDCNAQYKYLGYVFGASNSTYQDRIVPETLKTVKVIDLDYYSNDMLYRCINVEHLYLPNDLKGFSGSGYYYAYSENYEAVYYSMQYNEYENGYYLGSLENPYMVFAKIIDGSATTITIHPDCKFITTNSLSSATAITKLIVPEGVIDIGHSMARKYGSTIKDVYIPSTIKTIGSWALGEDSVALDNIYYGGTIDDWCKISIDRDPFSVGRGKHMYIKDDEGTVEFEGDKYSLVTELIIGDEVEQIPNYAFACLKDLTSVSISTSVTSIGDYAFEYCGDALTAIDYEGTMEQWNEITMGNKVFNNSKVATIHCQDGDINL